MDNSLIQRLGGTTGLQNLIDDAYTRVMNEKELRPFFKNSDVEKIKRMQSVFLEAALTDETTVSDTGISVRAAHHGRKITRHHFSLFVNCFLAALDDSHLASRDDIDTVIGRLNLYADEVLGITGIDG